MKNKWPIVIFLFLFLIGCENVSNKYTEIIQSTQIELKLPPKWTSTPTIIQQTISPEKYSDITPTTAPTHLGTTPNVKSHFIQYFEANSCIVKSVNIYNGEIRNLLKSAQQEVCRLRKFSPNGKKFAAIDKNEKLYVINVDGTEKVQINNGSMIFTWSPDSSKLAYQNAAGIWIINADGSNEHILGNWNEDFTVDEFSNGDQEISWSPDGEWIFATVMKPLEGNPDIIIHMSMIFNINGNDYKVLGKDGINGNAKGKWSPNSQELLFTNEEGGCQAVYYGVDGRSQKARVVALNGGGAPDYICILNLEWSTDGQSVYFAGSISDWMGHGYWIFKMNIGKTFGPIDFQFNYSGFEASYLSVQNVNDLLSASYDLSMSPDGSYVAFLSTDNYNGFLPSVIEKNFPSRITLYKINLSKPYEGTILVENATSPLLWVKENE